MKYSGFLLCLFLLTSCTAQTGNKIPPAVQEAFSTKYPNEHKPDFHKDSNGNFEAHFKKDGEKYRADFSPSGQWIETENSIKYSSLPKAVQDAVEANYNKDDITEIERVEHHQKGLFYDVEFKQKGKNHDVEFSSEGVVIGESN